ncbi:SOS response-associated peptidase family protein [Achromobacter sp. GG226]|uniref:SOS response-associated peptidase n=1 Tax=Verticiella alkaliphila TaxID=2779529 RepID=UPI001C0AF80B|nr:SOS response-associated peptidase family protein [Verticiella sp. GG226]MBU4609064.1 SOS response-associated peptidase family protein [Verticiella sp. GG226]
MCVRITQYAPGARYAGALGWPTDAPDTCLEPVVPGYNLAPGALVRIAHRLPDGTPRMQRMRWGHSTGKRRKPVVDARVENALTEPAFERLWQAGRCVVPIDSWYEWQGEKDRELPFRIHLPDDAPMFIAAIADLADDGAPAAEGGVIFITAQAGNGLLTARDHRPVILAAEDADVWMHPSTTAEQARLIAMELLLPPPAFQWHPVTGDIKDPAFDDARALEPMEEDAAS